MLEIRHISKRYEYTKVLDDISITFPECGIVSIVGDSGCGKSTLLSIIGGIDKEFVGDIWYQGKKVTNRLYHYRKTHVSFLFQDLYVLSWLNVPMNIGLSRFFHWQHQSKQSLNIDEFCQTPITSLSLGQRARVAYLRSVMKKGEILLCDEPTGSLDEKTGQQVMEALKEEAKHRLVILVSHDYHFVQNYSHEIYRLEDGKIKSHDVMSRCMLLEEQPIRQSKYPLSLLRLGYESFRSHRTRSFQLIFGLTLSFLCILLTFGLSHGLEKQVENYIYSLVPPTGISFQNANKQSLSIDSIAKDESILRVQYFLDHYESMGISFQKKRYEESQTLFIHDDSSPYDYLTLAYGQYPKSHHEILLSMSTASHLYNGDLKSCIGKNVYAWYKHGNKMECIDYVISGITKQSTQFDTLYQQPNAYIELLKNHDHFEENISLGMIYLKPDQDRHDMRMVLEKQYPKLHFKEAGKQTVDHVRKTMEKVRYVLYAFSGLAILSSLFLMGEVMFLNIVQRKKDLAIMRCYGASVFDTLKIVFVESCLIVLSSQIFGYVLYIIALNVMNAIFQNMMINDSVLFSIQYHMMLKVGIGAWGLIVLSQMIPWIYVLRLNTINALKS